MSSSADKEKLVANAEALGAVVVRAGSAIIVVIADTPERQDDLLSLEQARAITRDRTNRQLREAISKGDLAAIGGQRSRLVRRSDLLAWIESRRSPTIAPSNPDAIERRFARLVREHGGAA